VRHRREQGQATLELALLLPLLVAIVLFVIQAGLVARDRLALIHAAREAAREAVVDPDPASVRRAAVRATGLDPTRLAVQVTEGDVVMVIVTYRSPTDVPIVGRLMGEVRFRERFVSRTERG